MRHQFPSWTSIYPSQKTQIARRNQHLRGRRTINWTERIHSKTHYLYRFSSLRWEWLEDDLVWPTELELEWTSSSSSLWRFWKWLRMFLVSARPEGSMVVPRRYPYTHSTTRHYGPAPPYSPRIRRPARSSCLPHDSRQLRWKLTPVVCRRRRRHRSCRLGCNRRNRCP